MRDQVVGVSIERGDACVQGDDPEHADADDRGTVADGRGDERRLDQVLTHGEESLGDRLVADGVGQDGSNVRGTLVHKRFGREEVALLRGEVGGAGFKESRSAGGNEDHRKDDCHGTEHRHYLGKVGEYRGPEAGPQSVEQRTCGHGDDCLGRS
ncbi:hypothetical protein B879_04202 [Cecembia lonarensis LW9]|uniref:Uncharacterized protein n=1 Tax=Cecembia lonarensis (strain CCUG 58316 / KCTC 22772 / LW9) TaxID=1225176 RepID=K1L9X3_CECL9|nr:hypothetical protein B879_04202 [Cecembia lonarensis LW9]